MIYKDSFRVEISGPPPDAADVLRALLGMTVDDLVEAIAVNRDGQYDMLYASERETA